MTVLPLSIVQTALVSKQKLNEAAKLRHTRLATDDATCSIFRELDQQLPHLQLCNRKGTIG